MEKNLSIWQPRFQSFSLRDWEGREKVRVLGSGNQKQKMEIGLGYFGIFGQLVSWEMRFGQNLGWEIISSLPQPFPQM